MQMVAKGKPRVFSGIALIVLMALGLGDAPATAPAPDPAATTPRALIQSILADVTTILRNPQFSKIDRTEKVREIAYANIDFETLSRLTLARNWRGLSDADRTEFVALFKKHLSSTYAHTTDNYNNEDLTVIGERQEPDGDATVQTQIAGVQEDGKPEIIKVDYRLRQKDGQWKVIDVTVDGISLVANFRSQFQEIMANGGIDQLLQLLRDKNAAEAK